MNIGNDESGNGSIWGPIFFCSVIILDIKKFNLIFENIIKDSKLIKSYDKLSLIKKKIDLFSDIVKYTFFELNNLEYDKIKKKHHYYQILNFGHTITFQKLIKKLKISYNEKINWYIDGYNTSKKYNIINENKKYFFKFNNLKYIFEPKLDKSNIIVSTASIISSYYQKKYIIKLKKYLTKKYNINLTDYLFNGNNFELNKLFIYFKNNKIKFNELSIYLKNSFKNVEKFKKIFF